MFNDLRDFINKVEELGDCRVIEGADWNLEIGNITVLGQETANQPLLLFDKIKGYPAGYRVASNLYTTPRRIALALGLPAEASDMEMVKAWREKVKGGVKLVPPVEVKTGPIKENIQVGDEVDLLTLPTPKWHEQDGGRYIGTGTMSIMRDPDTGWVNIGTYRTQLQDKNTVTTWMKQGSHGDVIRRKYWARGLNCPVVVMCGQEPLLWAASTISAVEWGTSEYDYAGGLKGKPIEVVKGVTTDLPIPATGEIALEGEIVPPEVETRTEGPFGEWAGYYSGGPWPQPATRVKSVMHRNAPIIQGNPPSRFSTYSLGDNVRRSAAVWDHLDKNIPGVKGVWQVEGAGIMSILVVSIEQQHSGHARQAAVLAAGCGTTAYTRRWVIVVDDDIDPTNISEVLWALGTRTDPERSVDIIKSWWSGAADPMIPLETKMQGNFERSLGIIIACKPYHWIKEFPRAIKTSPEVLQKTREKWGKFLE
jgi:UbiD family decarboxylase